MRPVATYSVGPDGNAWQLGVEGTDVLGRLDWVAAASIGNDAGPRGGSLAASYRGLPVALSVHAFFAREETGSQRRRSTAGARSGKGLGGFVEGSWSRPTAGGGASLRRGRAAARVRPLAGGDEFDRALFRGGRERDRDAGSREKGFGRGRVTGLGLHALPNSWIRSSREPGVTAYSPPPGSPHPPALATRRVAHASSTSSRWAARRRRSFPRVPSTATGSSSRRFPRSFTRAEGWSPRAGMSSRSPALPSSFTAAPARLDPGGEKKPGRSASSA